VDRYSSHILQFHEILKYTKSDANIIDMKTAEDLMYMYLRTMNEFAFEQQFHFGIYYAWIRLKEQEIRNLRWICEMMELGKQKEKVANFIVPIFPPRPDQTHKDFVTHKTAK